MRVQTALENRIKTTLPPGTESWRVSTESLLPQHLERSADAPDGYNRYPFHGLGPGKIHKGYRSLALWMLRHQVVLIDGYSGVFWEEVYQGLQAELQASGVSVKWTFTDEWLKEEGAIEALVRPFLGEAHSVWGTRASLHLEEFFDRDRLEQLWPGPEADLHIVMGTGAALLSWEAPVVYLEVPKNEIQYRMRAGSITNLGAQSPAAPPEMYKRFYFVDWVVLNRHKKRIQDRIALVADVQWKASVNWILHPDLNGGLQQLSESVLRVRPWFEPGAWGGHWLQQRIEGLNRDAVNYAWSFELIVPENGLLFESDGNLLEVAFDWIMMGYGAAVLGRDAELFGGEFPLRFDFLDTWQGGHLSVQCHPSLAYIRAHFGERITQDETYYILECQQDAQVFLGFQEDIDPAGFQQVLRDSQALHQEVPITRYVQAHPARRHDLFLIPNGTVHSAGAGNLVLEISATPYIFTFKMYDWLRLDLDGKPRPIALDHAFHNLDFERKGDRVTRELICRPVVLKQGADWQLVHLPTHPTHFYDIHRVEFDDRVRLDTRGSVQVLMLVEGTEVGVITANGTGRQFHYAETFVIPAAAGSYTLVNNGPGRAKVIRAFIKENVCFPEASPAGTPAQHHSL